jgi:arsenate reductase
MADPTVVLFACVKNAGRSQIACNFFNQLVDPTSGKAVSAGSAPADHVHPEVAAVLSEVGIDISSITPQKLTPEYITEQRVAVLVTMGCGEACPAVPGARIVEWTIPDPNQQPLDRVREIRDLLKGKVIQLAQDLGLTLRSGASS